MKRIFLIFLFIALFSELYSQDLKWRLLSTSPGDSSGRIDDVFFINENTGWTFDQTGSFPNYIWKSYKTIDGGYTWSSSIVDSGTNLRCIGFADSLHGWIGTLSINENKIFRTTDGGDSWLPSLISSTSDSIGVCGISVINKDTVYATGRYSGPAHFYKTTNGGLNWSVTDLVQYGIHFLIDCHFFNADSGFITGGTGITIPNSKGLVLFTSNGGTTWVQRAITQNTYQWGWKISFPSRQVGYVSLERPTSAPRYFLKTTDGGETWEEKIFINASTSVQGIGFINETTGWIGGNYVSGFGNAGYETTDGGDTWNLLGYFKSINRIRRINDTLAYACGDRIYKYTRDSTVGVQNISTIIPDQLLLYQNYPNPFNPLTKIRFDVNTAGILELTLYNILCKKIRTLLNEFKSPGSYEYTFDASNLTSGVYYYTLTAQNSTKTMKMVIVK